MTVDLRLLGEMVIRLTRRIDRIEREICSRQLYAEIETLAGEIAALRRQLHEIGFHAGDGHRLVERIEEVAGAPSREAFLSFVNDLDGLEHWATKIADDLGLARPFPERSDNSVSVG